MSFEPNRPPVDPLDPPPSPPPVEAVFEQPGLTEGTGLPRNIAAALACIFPFFGGLVFYFLDRRDRFVRFYAWQSIVLGVVYFIACIAFDISIFIFHRVPVVGWLFAKAYVLVSLVLCAFWLCLVWNAYKGKSFELPVLWRVAKRYIPQVFL